MKTLNLSSIICSTILAISIVISSVVIQDNDKNQTATIEIKPLLTIKETAEYLNLSEKQVKFIVETEENALKAGGTYSGKLFPYIKVNNEILISKDELTQWIKEATLQRKQY